MGVRRKCSDSGQSVDSGRPFKLSKADRTQPTSTPLDLSTLSIPHYLNHVFAILRKGQEGSKKIKKTCLHFFKTIPPSPGAPPMLLEFKLIAAVVFDALKNISGFAFFYIYQG